MNAPSAQPTVQTDNESVRVTLWEFAPGAATGAHRHEMDYVVVPVVSGRLRLVSDSGEESFADLEAGRSYFRTRGVAHNVFNAGDAYMAFVEVELKGS
ncbi:MAG TPA: cupin domain-containing protein [Gammaproteobacteria bacterium]|nr:cupin domain-containing protein [Gammaproteobacteria bacterium]